MSGVGRLFSNKAYHLVVFDWEGTLGDTFGHVLKAIATVANRMQLGDIDEQVARQYVVLGLMVTVKKLFPDLSLYQHEQLLQSVQHTLIVDPLEICLIPGAKKTLLQMKQAGLELAVATNKGHHSLQRALQLANLTDLFNVTRAAGQVPAKPCPQMLEEIMDVCGALPSQTLMIGDSISDIEMARQINVDAIGIDIYQQQTNALREAGAIEVFDNYAELARYLQLPDLEVEP